MLFQKYKHIEQSDAGRIFAVGDVHGCLEALCALLDEIQFDPARDQMVFVGDLGDRGPQSMDTFNFVLGKPYFHVVAGNHEHMLCEHILGNQSLPRDLLTYWLLEDGDWTKSVDRNSLVELVDKIYAQSHFIVEVKTRSGVRFGITHAGYEAQHWFKPSHHYEDDEFGKMMWSRGCAECAPGTLPSTSGIDYTVHGHTVFRDPVLNGNAIFIDTGCAIGGRLTALDLGSFAAEPRLSSGALYQI